MIGAPTWGGNKFSGGRKVNYDVLGFFGSFFFVGWFFCMESLVNHLCHHFCYRCFDIRNMRYINCNDFFFAVF